MWIAANRDERAFEEPDACRLDRDQSKNLLWGAGIHICPGAPLARLELRLFLEELLSRTSEISLSSTKKTKFAVFPASGFSVLPVRVKSA